MSHFNHAFKKVFVATKQVGTIAESGTLGQSGSQAGLESGILTSTGVHVSKLKSLTSAEGYQLGVGVVAIIDAATDLSTDATAINAAGCKPFYIAGASIKLEDKQGPHHGGYQESNKSKIINPKFVSKVWKVESNVASRAVLEIGGTTGNSNEGGVLTTDTLVGGSGYTTSAVETATTGGTGVGLTVTYTAAAGAVTAIVIVNDGAGYTIGDTITIAAGGADATFDVLTVAAGAACQKEFLCGEDYNLRLEVKGTDALRFANHNLYRTLQSNGGCCADPDAAPVAVDATIIYKEWATQIAEDPYLKDFIRPLLVVTTAGVEQTFAYDSDAAIAEGLDPATELFDDAGAADNDVEAGLILVGAYVETKFGDCTFQCSDYYSVNPLQLTASEVDYNGDPCTFEGLCVTEVCPGILANGGGEEKLRELILSEAYLQNFFSSDLRIREITQGTAVHDVISRTSSYGSFYIQHSVPRYSNPSSVFSNDQYLLEIIGDTTTLDYLETEFDLLATDGAAPCGVEDFTGTTCTSVIPNP